MLQQNGQGGQRCSNKGQRTRCNDLRTDRPNYPHNTQRITRGPGGMPLKEAWLFDWVDYWHTYPANMRRWANVGSLLGHRRRRWPNSKPTLGQRLIFCRVAVRCSVQEGVDSGSRFQDVFCSPGVNQEMTAFAWLPGHQATQTLPGIN